MLPVQIKKMEKKEESNVSSVTPFKKLVDMNEYVLIKYVARMKVAIQQY